MFAISRLSRNLSPLQAVAGLVSIDSPHEDFEVRRDELLTAEEREQRKAMLAESRAGLSKAIRLEYEGPEQSREVYQKLKLPRDLPLIAFAAGRVQWLPERYAQQQEEIWREMQGKLAALNTNGQFPIVANSGHNMQLEPPNIAFGGRRATTFLTSPQAFPVRRASLTAWLGKRI